jgi:hypothetical protein
VNNFDGYESEAQRVARVEERMQVLELLFKAYYVDDEVFRSLDNGVGNGQADNKVNPFFDGSEKPQNGFSHMFNESTENHSQVHLNPVQDVHLRDMR